MAIIWIWWNYFDMIKKTLVLTHNFIYQNCIIIRRSSTKGSDPYKGTLRINLKKKCGYSNEDEFHHITAHMAIPFVTKKISPIRWCIDVLNSDVYSVISLSI